MYKIFLFLSCFTILELIASAIIMPFNKPLDEKFETLIGKWCKKQENVPDMTLGMRQACQSTLEIGFYIYKPHLIFPN